MQTHVFNDFWPKFRHAWILTNFAPEVYFGVLYQFLLIIFQLRGTFFFFSLKNYKGFFLFMVISFVAAVGFGCVFFAAVFVVGTNNVWFSDIFDGLCGLWFILVH